MDLGTWQVALTFLLWYTTMQNSGTRRDVDYLPNKDFRVCFRLLKAQEVFLFKTTLLSEPGNGERGKEQLNGFEGDGDRCGKRLSHWVRSL